MKTKKHLPIKHLKDSIGHLRSFVRKARLTHLQLDGLKEEISRLEDFLDTLENPL